MAETTTAPSKSEKKEPTEKERADAELKERLENEGPSPLLVRPAQTEPERLQAEGFAVVDIATAGLPGGGPANQYGMSAGGPTPERSDIEKGLDEKSKELEKERSEQEKRDKEKKEKQDKARADAKKVSEKKSSVSISPTTNTGC